MEIKRIFDLLDYCAEKYPDKKSLFAGKENGQWVGYSIDQYIEISSDIAYGLLALGIKKGDKIATITNNCPEWNFMDMGIMQAGAIHVPIYPTISEADYKYILTNAEVNYIFVSGEELIRKIEHILPEIPTIKEIYTFRNPDQHKHLNELIEIGRKNKNPKQLEEIKDSIKNNDIVTIIYTSGTTGSPKGAMLSHNNIISNFIAVSSIPPVDSNDRALSFLPLCHVYERMLNYFYQYKGLSVYYAQNTATVADDAREIKPHIMSAVPRFIEKVFNKIMSSGHKLKGIKKIIFFWAANLALKYELNRANGWWYEIKLKIADKLVYVKWRDALGGNFKLIVSGGAALQPRLSRFFWAAKIQVIEGYGLTETSPVIAVGNFWKDGIKFGTVGPPIQGVKVKIAEDGEVLCKGPNVMVGYYKEPDITSKMVDDEGWFHTGDLGMLEPEGQLRLTGRKNEIFKTSLGKYVNPLQLEDKLKESPFIDNLIVVGENQKYATALIVPDFNHIRLWCIAKGVSYTNNSEIITLPKIRKRFQQEVETFNKQFGSVEQVKKIELIGEEWSVVGGELTPTLKLKRKFICNKYQHLIDKLYN